MKQRSTTVLAMVCTLVIFLQTGCVGKVSLAPQPTISIPQPSPEPSIAPPTSTPTLVLSPTVTPEPVYNLWIHPAIPKAIQDAVLVQSQLKVTAAPDTYSFRIEMDEAVPGEKSYKDIRWIYALVAAFPTITDGYTSEELRSAWSGKPDSLKCTLMMDHSTYLVMSALWGPSTDGAVREVPADQLLTVAWQEKNLCAILPFEDLSPRWKVLRVDDVMPYDRNFDPQKYPLTFHFHVNGGESNDHYFRNGQNPDITFSFLPSTNRNPEQLTVLVMTGVTAMVRATAWKMDTLGILFPGSTIRDVLLDADVTHISNEVPFAPNCPPGNPGTSSLIFCSRPEYIQLLEDVGADVIELTGNHMNDWGPDNFLYTLDLYKQHGFRYFAGGANLEEARKALIVEDHGNRLAFIGCNPAGPASDWATDTLAGSASCDLDWEASEIQRLRSEGYLPIATFQYDESYTSVPVPWQVKDFQKISEAGAVIVSGSQAHYPQTFEFIGDNLIHYGPGNLFFDQIFPIINGVRIEGTRWEFIDRHIFYDGRYIGTDLVTAMLEDYARPRLMTAEERVSLLSNIFNASGW
jgi:poly-gamma-glutamate synthesis protein (capsule biosynthesis protein)